MAEPRTRRPAGASTTYKGADGDWHGRVTVGTKDDGRSDRRHVRGPTQAVVIRKVRELEKARDAGQTRKAGDAWTVEKWLTHWVENIAAAHVRENTLSGYRVAVYVHLIPGIGKHRLAKLEPEHLEKLYSRMMRNGSKPATAHQVHRTVRTALNEAVRRRHLVTVNPATIAKAPSLSDDEIEPYSVEEIKRLLVVATERRNATRWAIALALGLRQGEALGLKWADLDLDAGNLTVRRARQRPRWKHGCPRPCGRKHGGHCPDRVPARAATAETKSRAGRRTIGLPDELVAVLRQHREVQQAERVKAGQLWQEGGWLFATPTGEPLNPRTDYTEWKRLLVAAGIRDGRLHDARHTAATVLLLLGVSERAVMGLMGWSNTAMAARYQHMTGAVQRDVADRIGVLLWAAEKMPRERGTEGDDRPAGGPVPPR